MVATFQVLVTCPEEDEERNQPVEAILRVMDRMLSISRFCKQRGSWRTWKYRHFPGPWPLQWALTPLFIFNGILFTNHDLLWMETGANQRRLRITPLAPADFWVDIQFRTGDDADVVAGLIGQWSRSPSPRQGGLAGLIRRWPEAVVAPLFALPAVLGLARGEDAWVGVGIAAYVVGGMLLTCRQEIGETRGRQDDPSPLG